MLKLLKFAQQLRGKFESRAFEKATREPEKIQKQFLLDLLRKNSETHFGREHDFAGIKSEADFRARVPVRDYEELRPFVDRIVKGEREVLTKENPFMFTITSGTTGEPKYIPVTRESQAANSRLMRQWISRAELDHPGVTAESGVAIVSRAVEGFTASGMPYGSASGVIYKNIPSFIRRAYAVPYAVSEIENYDERYFLFARFALASRVSFIATPNPSTLLRLARICVENQDALVQAIYDGTPGVDLKKQPEIYAELSAALKPEPARARQLSAVIAENGFLKLAECWTDLRLIGCWLGGSVGVQSKRLGEIFGDVPQRDLGYLASEGNFTMPVAEGNSSGILALENGYYEFVPEDEIDSAEQRVLSAYELEAGRRYGILLTTAAGLYRYQINDIVEVTGFYHETPLVAFVRKSGDMANITGEKMHANHFVQAFHAMARKFELDVEQFRAVPDAHEHRYEIYLELKQNFSRERLRREVLPELDRALQRINIEYEQKRRSKRLEMPLLYLMKKGWSDEGLRRHIAEGKRDSQYKPPIIRPERTASDESFIAARIDVDNSKAIAEKAFILQKLGVLSGLGRIKSKTVSIKRSAAAR